MTDRTRCLVVVLEDQFRVDDAQQIIDAIRMVRGVASVDIHVQDFGQHIAIETARRELRGKLWDVLNDDPPKKK